KALKENSMSIAPSTLLLSTQHAPPHITTRPCASFPPSFWGDNFLQYHSHSLVSFQGVAPSTTTLYFLHLPTLF
ncbi:hypothetical protein VIGAN_07118200, partial [Vigna angularis var. angularis]